MSSVRLDPVAPASGAEPAERPGLVPGCCGQPLAQVVDEPLRRRFEQVMHEGPPMLPPIGAGLPSPVVGPSDHASAGEGAAVGVPPAAGGQGGDAAAPRRRFASGDAESSKGPLEVWAPPQPHRRDTDELQRERFEQLAREGMLASQPVPALSAAAPTMAEHRDERSRGLRGRTIAGEERLEDAAPRHDLLTASSSRLRHEDSGERSRARGEPAARQNAPHEAPHVLVPARAGDPHRGERSDHGLLAAPSSSTPRPLAPDGLAPLGETGVPPPVLDEALGARDVTSQRRPTAGDDLLAKDDPQRGARQPDVAQPGLALPAASPQPRPEHDAARPRRAQAPDPAGPVPTGNERRDDAAAPRRTERDGRSIEEAPRRDSALPAPSSPERHPPWRERASEPLEAIAPAVPAPHVIPGSPLLAPATAEQDERDTRVREYLVETVQQLMTGNVQPGAHPQLFMVLRDDYLPGTTVAMQTQAAQLEVIFECSVQASRQFFDRCAPVIARSLARQLGRNVVVRVQAGSGGGWSPIEVHAQTGEADE